MRGCGARASRAFRRIYAVRHWVDRGPRAEARPSGGRSTVESTSFPSCAFRRARTLLEKALRLLRLSPKLDPQRGLRALQNALLRRRQILTSAIYIKRQHRHCRAERRRFSALALLGGSLQ